MKGRGRNAKVRKRRRKQRNQERLAAALRGGGERNGLRTTPDTDHPLCRVFEGRLRGGTVLRLAFGPQVPWPGDAPLTVEEMRRHQVRTGSSSASVDDAP